MSAETCVVHVAPSGRSGRVCFGSNRTNSVDVGRWHGQVVSLRIRLGILLVSCCLLRINKEKKNEKLRKLSSTKSFPLLHFR